MVTTLRNHKYTRKPCKEFAHFEPLFKQAQAELHSKKKVLVPFRSERQIEPERLFILQGMMVWVAARGKWEKKNFGNVNARLYCVFENGTESNMLLRSLAAALWKDENSRQVVDADQRELFSEEGAVDAADRWLTFRVHFKIQMALVTNSALSHFLTRTTSKHYSHISDQ
jgi:hypothetical protein